MEEEISDRMMPMFTVCPFQRRGWTRLNPLLWSKAGVGIQAPGETGTTTHRGLVNKPRGQPTLSSVFCLTAGLFVHRSCALLSVTGECATLKPAACNTNLNPKQSAAVLHRNPGAACLPLRCSCCRARWEISCSALEGRHLSVRGFPSEELRRRLEDSSAPDAFARTPAPPAGKAV